MRVPNRVIQKTVLLENRVSGGLPVFDNKIVDSNNLESFLDVYTRGCRICTTKEAELVGGKGKTDARLGTNKRFKIWYLPQNLYQLVATQWISNSAGNQIEIEKGQIDYWEKGEAQKPQSRFEIGFTGCIFTIKIYISHQGGLQRVS